MAKGSPAPLIVNPSIDRTHTLIMLHGTGSNSQRFAYDLSDPEKPGFLQAQIAHNMTLQQCLPSFKFIFPQASQRRCTARSRMRMNIWFDSASFEDQSLREELHIDGIQENTQIIKDIIEAESQLIGANKVFLGGISQGCSMALYTLLSLELDGKHLAGFIGLSGRMPFQDDLDRILTEQQSPENQDGGDHFVFHNEHALSTEISTYGEESEVSRVLQAASFIKEDILDGHLNPTRLETSFKTSLFFGHGSLEEVVPLSLGLKISQTLQTFGFQVTQKIYPNLGHWFETPTELEDIVTFLREQM